jgi:hypothetical protein
VTITNTWSIVKLEAYPEYANKTNVVFTVHWNLTGTEDTHTGYMYGSVGLEFDEESDYTPYDDLTQEQVIGWVHKVLGAEQVMSYEENVANQIELSKNPTVVYPTLPWVEKTTEELPMVVQRMQNMMQKSLLFKKT